MVSTTENAGNINNDSTQQKTDMNKADPNLNEQSTYRFGHDLNDQRLFQTDKQQQFFRQLQLRSIKKFDGHGNAEHWLTDIMEQFDSLQFTTIERNELISDILTGDAIIWYIKQQDYMPTFMSFIKNFLQHYNDNQLNEKQSTAFISSSIQSKQPAVSDYKETVMNSLRNQMLMSSLEKLPKFTGKLKQNVSKWLREIQQTMHMLKLKDEEKLYFIPLCLEADARDWFYDNMHLFPTWISFTNKLLKTFESSGKADISFNRLRHYEQGITEDLRQYYFQIMKLCKEANPLMDDTIKLQFLKDGLKPSLRFDVLLKNPKNPEEFLEYAQKIEELKSLDSKQDVIESSPAQQSSYNNLSANTITTQDQYQSRISKPPYQCYNCGANDHYYRNCPHFQ